MLFSCCWGQERDRCMLHDKRYDLHMLLRVMLMLHSRFMSWWWWYMIWYSFVMIWYIFRSISWVSWYLLWYVSWCCYHMFVVHLMVLGWGTSLMISYDIWCMAWLIHIMSDMVYSWGTSHGTWFMDVGTCLRHMVWGISWMHILVMLVQVETHG